MSVKCFEEENAYREKYQRYGLHEVLKSTHKELDLIQSLIFTVNAALEHQDTTPHEKEVTELAGNMAFELQHKLEKLTDHLTLTGLPVILKVPNPHLPPPHNQVGGVE